MKGGSRLADSKINLYIIDNSQSFTDKLEEIFFENRNLGINVIGSARRASDAVEDHKNIRQANVFLVSASLPDKSGVDLINQLKNSANKQAYYILTVNAKTRNLVEKGLEQGADAYLQKPVDARKLVEMVYEGVGKTFVEEDYSEEDEVEGVYEENTEEEFEIFEIEEEVEVPSEDEVEERKSREMVDLFGDGKSRNIFQKGSNVDEKPSKVIVFTAPKSVGKTTILVNVAAAIKKNSEYDPKIVILDLNLVYPSVQFKFNQEDLIFSKKNIYDVINDIGHLDEEMIKEALLIHEPTKINIIDTPFESIRDFNRVTGEKIKQLILYLREIYDVVLIDSSGNIREDATAIPLTLSDTNVVMFESDLSSLLHTRKFVEMIQLIEKKTDKKIIDKSYFILNRFRPDNLSIDLIKEAIFDIEGAEMNVPLYIPEEPLMTKYSDNGIFIVDKPGDTGDKINELASMLYPFYTDGESYNNTKSVKSSLLSTLLSRFKK